MAYLPLYGDAMEIINDVASGTDLLAGKAHRLGDSIVCEPWGVVILKSRLIRGYIRSP